MWPAWHLLQVQDAVDGTFQLLCETIVLWTVAREAYLVHVWALGLALLGRWHCGGLPAGIPTRGWAAGWVVPLTSRCYSLSSMATSSRIRLLVAFPTWAGRGVALVATCSG